MMYLRYRRTKNVGHGNYVTATNRGVRVGHRTKGRRGLTMSIGSNGRPYVAIRLGNGFSLRIL